MAMSRKIIILLCVTLMLIVLMMPNQATAAGLLGKLSPKAKEKILEIIKGTPDRVEAVKNKYNKEHDGTKGSLPPLGCRQRCAMKCLRISTQYAQYKKPCMNLCQKCCTASNGNKQCP